MKPSSEETPPAQTTERPGLLSRSSTLAMFAGLAGGYGFFAYIAGRFLYPARPQDRQWTFVIETDRVSPGESVLYRAPSGETINVARQGNAGDVDDFIALSSTCPHLGCQVHWEAARDRFFCPCHNGVFDPSGRGLSGPPGDAGLSLPRYNLKIDNGLLFIEIPVTRLTQGRGEVIDRVEGIHGPGHDPCLAGRRPDGSHGRVRGA